MNMRTIITHRIPSSEIKSLAPGFLQCRWKEPTWQHGSYRVYFNGKLVAITHQTSYNFMETAAPPHTVIEVFGEIRDVPK